MASAEIPFGGVNDSGYGSEGGTEAMEASPKPRIFLVTAPPPQFLGDGESPDLWRFLVTDPQGRKRFRLSEQLADLHDQYQVYRANWIAK